MRTLFVLLVLIQSSFIYSQQRLQRGAAVRQGGVQQHKGSFSNTNRPRFNSKKISGINKFNEKKILKLLKIVKNDSVAPKIKASFLTYNVAMDSISIANKEVFRDADNMAKSAMQRVQRSKNREVFNNEMKLVFDKLKPIKKKVKLFSETLNESLAGLLTEKQYQKWVKYQKTKKSITPIGIRRERKTIGYEVKRVK